MKKGIKCWDLFECHEEECPVYSSKEPMCWLVEGTHCRDEIQGKFLEKIEMCLACEVFTANVDADSIEETLKAVSDQFTEFARMVKERDRELEGISIELAVGLSEVFEALKEISLGNPEVRLSEASEYELIAKLKHMVNTTAETLGEIVDLSHEFAIGLAEHFDTLHRVSRGDLNARVLGTSKVELLESLKTVTNHMIESVDREMRDRRRAEAALEKARGSLEVRVKERTAELTEANRLLKQQIEERERAEEALRDSEKRYRTLFEDSRDAIYITAREGEFIDVNQSALDLFGYEKEEMVGLNVKEVYVNPERRSQFREEIEIKGSVTDYPIKFHKKDGMQMDCLVTASVRYAGDGSIFGYQGLIRDITERKRLEAQLQQAQKLEAIGTLAGGIAHDFNNLLMGIQGNISLMGMDIDPEHPYAQRFRNIEKQIKSGTRLTSHLLGYARKGRYEVKALDLSELIDETVETFGRTRKEITIRRDLADDLAPVEVDAAQIEQVLFNLFVNAADAMATGGELTLKAVNTTHTNMTGKLYDPKPGRYVLLEVSDTGTGMDKETAERIFDPFFTTKERGRGTGLGLASAYGIVKGHGGYIDVDSAPGRGTTFSIYLPATRKRVRKVRKRTRQLLKGNETVLLVDDEDEIRQVGHELLEAMGYQVIAAKNGKEALEAYDRHQNDIDIVLLDMVMPSMGGGETYDRLKEIDPDIKVLLSSGFSIDGEAAEILARGCNGFIQKPFTMRELSGRIREIIDKK